MGVLLKISLGQASRPPFSSAILVYPPKYLTGGFCYGSSALIPRSIVSRYIVIMQSMICVESDQDHLGNCWRYPGISLQDLSCHLIPGIVSGCGHAFSQSPFHLGQGKSRKLAMVRVK